mmetsp:Transcript_5377/g.18201  ORF Transcript_5377/g.18201 Transcript_5377/m.18201 type:complete len:255 (+) Transcript_5377:1108-1872(+)
MIHEMPMAQKAKPLRGTQPRASSRRRHRWTSSSTSVWMAMARASLRPVSTSSGASARRDPPPKKRTTGGGLLAAAGRTSTSTVARSNSPASRSRRASGLTRCCWMALRTGRAPYAGSYPASASQASAWSDSCSLMPRLRRRSAALPTSSLVTSRIWSLVSRLKSTISSRRLMNSGARCARTLSITSARAVSAGRPSGSAARAAAPRLEVSTMRVLLKLTRFPWESVRCPSSSTWSSRVLTSRWAFSNSSKRSTQ